MSNEISLSLSLSCTNGGYSASQTANSSYNQNAVGASSGVVSVPTASALLTPSVGTYGWLWLKNLDPANYVVYGLDNAGAVNAFGKLKAGEVAVLRLAPGIAFRWQANTAPVAVHWWCLND